MQQLNVMVLSQVNCLFSYSEIIRSGDIQSSPQVLALKIHQYL